MMGGELKLAFPRGLKGRNKFEPGELATMVSVQYQYSVYMYDGTKNYENY